MRNLRASVRLTAMATLAVLLAACGEAPTPTPAPTATPTAVPAPTATPIPAPAATATPVPTETPSGAALSLDAYAAWCSGALAPVSLDEDATNREVSAVMAEIITATEAVSPPPEVLAWHRAMLALAQAFKTSADAQPGDEILDPLALFGLLPVAAAVEEAEASMAEDARARLMEAGCIESEPTPESGPEQGSSFDEPENLLGPFSPGESVPIGGYEVEVTDAYQGEDSLVVRALFRNADRFRVEQPDCDVYTSLQDAGGRRYGRKSCGWSWGSPGTPVFYRAEHEAPPERATGLLWVFSDGDTGAAFDLSPLLLFHAGVREALAVLYNTTNGPNWTDNRDWLSDKPLYEGYWYGVGISFDDPRVVQLNLINNQLSGPIPPELGNLTDLTHLDLSGNQLTGPIPPELGNLTDLTRLELSDNQLSGPIPPELGNLTDLTHLDLSDNQLSGPIPPELGNLANLEWLLLDGNQLSGCIPSELQELNPSGLSQLGLQLCDGTPTSGTAPTPGVTAPTEEPGFVVPRAYGLTSVLELDGAAVCALSGTQALDLVAFAERNNLNFATMIFFDIQTLLEAYLTGQCDAATASRLQIETLKTLIDSFAPDPGAHVILP